MPKKPLAVICTFPSQTFCAAMVTCSFGPNDTGPHGMAIYATYKTGSQHLDNQPCIEACFGGFRLGCFSSRRVAGDVFGNAFGMAHFCTRARCPYQFFSVHVFFLMAAAAAAAAAIAAAAAAAAAGVFI